MRFAKKVFTIVLCIVLVAAAAVGVSADAASGISVVVNGEEVVFDQPPITENGRILVPLRAIFEALGAKVNWNQSTQMITAVKDNTVVTLRIGSSFLEKNGVPIRIDVPARTVAGRTLVPARAIAESFNAIVAWEQRTQTVTIRLIPVQSIALESGEITMDRYDSLRLNPTIFPANATDKKLTYKTDNANVARVSDNGSIYAAGAGAATITCVASNGVQTSCQVTVIVPVTSVYVRSDRYRYKTGETSEFSVTVYPDDATDKSYTVDISGVGMSLMENNEALCISSGTAIITATASNGVSGSRDIEVIDLNEYAAEVLRLANIERANRGVRALSGPSSLLASAAMTRAAELISNFSHSRPDGRSCFTALDEYMVSYWTAGENIASGQRTPESVISGWMNSDGHRRNILNSSFTQLGVGVEMDNRGSLYWVQLFIG